MRITTSPGAAPAEAVFVRRASGLTRDVSAWSVFGFNVMNANVGIGLVWLLLLAPGLYPGANLYLAIVIAFAGMLPINLLYVRLASAYPRSGGDYVFVSRILSPAAGFAINAAAMAYFCLFVGVGGLYTVQYGLAPLVRVWAAYSADKGMLAVADWLTSASGTFLVSLLVLAAYAALMVVGARFYRVQSMTFVVGMLALVGIVLAGFALSHHSALAGIDRELARIGAGPLASLATGTTTPFSWSTTLHAAIWPWIVFLGCYFSVFIGGEVRRPARGQTIGILGSMTWALLWMLLVTWAMLHLFGGTLFPNLLSTAPAKLGLRSTPTFAELTALSLRSAVPAVLLMAAFTVWGFAWVGPTAMCVSRSMLAWSLDGLGPRWLAGVHRRWHTPHHALYVTFVIAAVWTALLTYGGLTLLSGMVVMFIEWSAVAVAAIVLPRVYESRGLMAPPPGRFLGLPAVSWWGIVSLPAVLLAAWLNLGDVNSGTSLQGQPGAIAAWIAILLGCVLVYYGIAAWRGRRGLRLGAAYQCLPPE